MARTYKRLDARGRSDILRLQAEGLSRNQIAANTGYGAGTVTRCVEEAGRSFDRSNVVKATEASVADTRIKLATVAARSAAVAIAAIDSLAAMTPEQWLKVIPYHRALIAGILADKAFLLTPPEQDDALSLPAVEAWLAEVTGTP